MYIVFFPFLILTYHIIGAQENGKENDDATIKDGKPLCHKGWIPFTGKRNYTYCLLVQQSQMKTWHVAENDCLIDGGHLLTVETADQIDILNKAIEEQVQKSPLVSLNSKNSNWINGWWIGLGQVCPSPRTDQMPELRWTDGSVFDDKSETIVDLKLLIPETEKWDDHYCVTYHYEKFDNGSISNYFNLTSCYDLRPYICQRPAYVQQDRADPKEKEEDEKNESGELELTKEFPCGRDPLYCPRKTSQGTVCYHLQQKKTNYWEQASEECDTQYQSDLTSMHSKEEAEFIYQMVQLQPIKAGEVKYWIGLHRRNAISQYEWSDGSPFDYMVHQVANEDVDDDNGACVAMQFDVSTKEKQTIPGPFSEQTSKMIPAYAWVHQRCDKWHPGICRKPGFDYNTALVKSVKEERQEKKLSNWKCPDGYKLFRSMCYKVFGTKDNGVTFSEAIEGCNSEKAKLVSLNDIYENGFVVSLLQGLRRNAWIGMDMTDGRVRWLDGEPLKLVRFSPDNRIIRIGADRHVFQNSGQPGFSHEACVALDATGMIGYWDVIFNTTAGVEKQTNATGQCESTKLPYVCETYADESPDAVKTKKTCYDIDYVTYCFLLNDPHKDVNGYYSFMAASEICAALPKLNEFKNLSANYGQLAQADNLFEWSFLTSLALENDYDELFMGVRYKKSIGFERMDKLRLRLAPWGVGEPNLKNGDCVVLRMDKDGPAWYMDDCMKRKPVVCTLTKEEPMSEIPQTVRCPDGKEDWILGQTQCYRLVSNASLISSGYKAGHDCFKYFNASLASFETREDFEQFKSHVLHEPLSVSKAIIGLIRQQHGSYAWKDSSPVTFLNWAEGEPADTKGRITQECVQMQLSGNYTWHSITCWQSRHFLCSVPVVDAYAEPKKEADKSDVLPLPPPEENNDDLADGDKKTRKESGGGNPDAKTSSDDDLTVENSSSSSPTMASSSFGTIIGIIVFLVVVAVIVSTVYIWRRKRKPHSGYDQRIIQFDSLQTEEENEI